MTPKNKEEIRQAMLEYLKQFGYPDSMSNEQILQHLPSLWNHLQSKGLLAEVMQRGFDYGMFVQIALAKKQESDIMEEVARHFRGRQGF